MTCWLCRIIGHKWTTDYHLEVDGAGYSEVVLWGCCLRCGQPKPDGLRNKNHAPVDNGPVSA